MVERIHDALFLNLLAQHPDVAPHVRHIDVAEIAGHLLDQRNIVLREGRGVMVLEWCAPDIYEGHFMAAPPTRGRQAINAAKACFREMFEGYDARMIWGGVAVANKRMRWFARQIGMSSHGVQSWPGGDIELFIIERKA